MTDIELKFEEPPPSRRGGSRRDYGVIVEALKARPGEWAVVEEAATNHHPAIVPYFRRHPEACVEMTMRTNPDKTYRVYARYVGEAQR